MNLKTAIEILQYHQEWRQGRRDDMIHTPASLTQALDIVLELAVNHKQQIIDAHKEGNKYNGWALPHEHEQYYNETYEKE